ncbi:MAG: DUF4912 domain-containing protein, partial [Pyrinomonadaceae bacterium]|nr:DUF4912 domain-containing protein [Pyrinomonadaceae bacterium]
MSDINTDDAIEFVLDESGPVSSGELLDTEPSVEPAEPMDLSATETPEEMSPVFKELAAPRLPQLSRENRARLQMQSPNRLHFYWSVRTNPFQALNRALGTATGDYTLVLRLLDIKRDAEQMHAVDAEGNWWFNVDADSDYRAEIGFYSPSRPFVRVMYSNTVHTPRKSPSPRVATDADWRVPAHKFAEVLDASGFRQDAFDVAIAGDNAAEAENASQRAFARMSGRTASEFAGIDAEELRYAMLALAAGATLEQLRFRIGERLFAVLQSIIDSVDKAKALAALKSEFE